MNKVFWYKVQPLSSVSAFHFRTSEYKILKTILRNIGNKWDLVVSLKSQSLVLIVVVNKQLKEYLMQQYDDWVCSAMYTFTLTQEEMAFQCCNWIH